MASMRMILIEGKPVDGNPCVPINREHCDRLLDIFHIEILRVGTSKSAKLFGKIDLTYSYGFWYLYDRDESEAETIQIPGFITLKNPPFAVQAYDPFHITFELKGGFAEMDEELGWLPHYCKPCDQILVEEISGTNCSLAVTYIVFDKAVVADVQIKLLKGNDEPGGSAKIYGSISATRAELSSILFRREYDDCVDIKEEDLIPLYKPLVSAPFEPPLDIYVDLWCFPDAPLARAIVRFVPDVRSEHVGIVSGPYGKVQVKVAFSRYSQHPETVKDQQACINGTKDY